MNKKQINEGNILIAEFMGYKHSGKKGNFTNQYVNEKEEYIHINDFKYNLSWDKLMLVVDKIDSITGGCGIRISHNTYISWWYSPKKHTTFSQGSNPNSKWKESRTPFDAVGGKHYSVCVSHPLDSAEKIKAETKIEATWIACIEFIKWYNKIVLKHK